MTEIIWQAAKVVAVLAMTAGIAAVCIGMSWLAAEVEREEERRRRRGRGR